jgi:hypothetical protein
MAQILFCFFQLCKYKETIKKTGKRTIAKQAWPKNVITPYKMEEMLDNVLEISNSSAQNVRMSTQLWKILDPATFWKKCYFTINDTNRPISGIACFLSF